MLDWDSQWIQELEWASDFARLTARVLHCPCQVHSAGATLCPVVGHNSSSCSSLQRMRDDSVHLSLRICGKLVDSNNDSNAKFRSEEHTSELQSLMRISYAVFCLKKKKTQHTKTTKQEPDEAKQM